MMSKKINKENEEIFENDDELIDDPEEDEEVIEDKDICGSSEFAFLGKIKRKSGTYERVVIVNRWAWMTDNKYRKIYPPVMEILKSKGFKEKDLALVEINMEKEEITQILTSLHIRYNELLENHAKTYFKNAKM